MASEKKDTGDVLKSQNVFLRILNLRSVSAALESIEKTYTSTKQSHSIIRSVCGLYEKGVRRAGSLAVWSLQPALHVLEPQLVAANSMACRGLDRLEEKVPALQSQPAELAANIKELMSSTLETAKDGIACPIKQTSNVVLDKVSTGYQQSKNAIRDGIQFVLNSKLVYLAEQRANRALSLTENLVEYVLPVSSAETEDDGSMREQEPDFRSSGQNPSFGRLRALADAICRRAFEKTAAQLQRSKRQGQELVTQIPGVSSLVEYTMKTMKTIGGVILGLPNSVAAFLKAPQKEMTNNEHEKLEIPRRSSKPGGSQPAGKDGAEECLSDSLVLEAILGDHMHGPSHNSEKPPLKTKEPREISEETRQLKKLVIKQIPMQQKVVLGGSNKKSSNHRSSRKSLTDYTKISSSSKIHTVPNGRNAK
ncbi:perilipin-1 isoform X2 [Pimephales promelas]|uniref:perilipin-1 isoform X2 n=1 Tax=Pimephales promelas TaxID=90988 RepID=UPI001955B540|nr:perilipin-1 isoform X2 [Pimephales promelas]